MIQTKWSHHIFIKILGDSLVLPKNKFAKEEFWSPLRLELHKAIGQKDVEKYVVVTW